MGRFFMMWLGLLLAGSVQAVPVDHCPQARDPARCVARQQAQDECQDLRGRARQQCLLNHLPPPDCHASDDPARCQQRQQARAACKGKSGKVWRACLKAQEAR